MNIEITDFLSADFLKFFIPLAGGVIAWMVNEYRKRQSDEYLRKEERYRGLLLSLRGFYESAEDLSLKQAFANELALCWLYCSDDVIEKANAFIRTLKENSGATGEEKVRRLSALIGAVRKDLLSRRIVRNTSLTGNEFERLSVSLPNTSLERTRDR